MARKKSLGKTGEATSLMEVLRIGDLSARVQKISDQTGLSPSDLLQKWLLQEEFLIGTLRRSEVNLPKQGAPVGRPGRKPAAFEPAPRRKRVAVVTPATESDNYRLRMVEKAQSLRVAGLTLNKIADTFNDESLPTISGSGRWHASSVSQLLHAKKTA